VKRKVIWSNRGTADYLDALSFIAADNPEAAERFAARLLGAAEALGRVPTGRPGRGVGYYEKSLPDVNYIIAYSLDDPPGTVAILRVIHAARNWSAGSWPD
jgi:plasmid stabilization system protein ParE